MRQMRFLSILVQVTYGLSTYESETNCYFFSVIYTSRVLRVDTQYEASAMQCDLSLFVSWLWTKLNFQEVQRNNISSAALPDRYNLQEKSVLRRRQYTCGPWVGDRHGRRWLISIRWHVRSFPGSVIKKECKIMAVAYKCIRNGPQTLHFVLNHLFERLNVLHV